MKFCSLKIYTVIGYKKALGEVKFPYQKFDNKNDAYSSLIKKLMEVINKVVPVKNKRIRNS